MWLFDAAWQRGAGCMLMPLQVRLGNPLAVCFELLEGSLMRVASVL